MRYNIENEWRQGAEIMKKFIYAISDIHGEYELFKELIQYFDPTMHQLVLIGDLNDRGPKVKESFLLGKELVEKYDAVYLRGNHEEYFLQFLNKPEDWFTSYIRNGGKETIESLLHIRGDRRIFSNRNQHDDT